MANKGWIKLWRKLTDSDMYTELNSKQRDVTIQCLLLANHKEREWEWKGEICRCNPGQFKTSLASLKKHCADDISIQNIRTALKKLERWDFLTNKSTKSGRIISICNWQTYQKNGKETNKDNNRQLTKNQQRANKELTTNKNVKNVKNDKEDKELAKKTKLFLSEFNKLFDRSFRYTQGRKNKMKTRLKTFTFEEIITALKNLSKSEWHQGENDRGWKADPDFLLKNNERIDKWLNLDLKDKPKSFEEKIEKAKERLQEERNG